MVYRNADVAIKQMDLNGTETNLSGAVRGKRAKMAKRLIDFKMDGEKESEGK
jgi:hypothetical protein